MTNPKPARQNLVLTMIKSLTRRFVNDSTFCVFLPIASLFLASVLLLMPDEIKIGGTQEKYANVKTQKVKTQKVEASYLASSRMMLFISGAVAQLIL